MPDLEQTTEGEAFKLSVKVTMGLGVLVITALLFEAGARIIYVYRDDIRAGLLASVFVRPGLNLDAFEMESPLGASHWVLRPGYEATRKKLILHKRQAGKIFGAGILEANKKFRGDKGEILFRINADGYKGPDIDASHARPRILTLGDSTTFGIGAKEYPRVMEAALERAGISVEVINGGVEGYFPRNVIFEIGRYKKLKPEIVTLYIGWNPLFVDTPWSDAWENRLRAVWLVDRASRALRLIVGDQQVRAMKMYTRDLTPMPDSPKVKALEAFTPPFMDNIEKIIDEFQSIGSKVVLVTLPGLFTMSVIPSPRALEIGHLPYFTKNPYVLAKLTERFNVALRGLAERRGLSVIDLEQWSLGALKPRENFFSDSIHLTGRGLEMVGEYMAGRLANRLEKLRNE